VAKNYTGGGTGRWARALRGLAPVLYTLLGAGLLGAVWLLTILL
jgi:hypothetical protein